MPVGSLFHILLIYSNTDTKDCTYVLYSHSAYKAILCDLDLDLSVLASTLADPPSSHATLYLLQSTYYKAHVCYKAHLLQSTRMHIYELVLIELLIQPNQNGRKYYLS